MVQDAGVDSGGCDAATGTHFYDAYLVAREPGGPVPRPITKPPDGSSGSPDPGICSERQGLALGWPLHFPPRDQPILLPVLADVPPLYRYPDRRAFVLCFDDA